MADPNENQSPADVFGQESLEILIDLERRSRLHAVGLPQQKQIIKYWEGVVFHVGNDRVVCPLEEIREVLNVPVSMTKVPGTNPWLIGVSNIRGTIVPITDLQLFLTGESTIRSRRNRVLIFNLWTGLSGILVGEMVGIRHFPKENITSKKVLPVAFDKFVSHGFEQDGLIWPVFSITKLAEDPNYQNAAL